MHYDPSAVPPRVRKIVDEELAAAPYWVGPRAARREMVLGSYSKFSAKVRGAIWWRISNEPGPSGKPPSSVQIGKWFGADHSTVLVSVKKFPENMQKWAAAKQHVYATHRYDHMNAASRTVQNIKAYT